MSSNNAYVIRKISENCFEVRYVACMDNDIPTDELPLEATCNNLEEAMKIANKEYTEYGVMYEDDSHKDVSKNNNEDITKIKAIIADGLYDMNDEEEFDKKILQKTIDDFNNHDELSVLTCAHCGSKFLTERAGLTYHNHLPLGQCVDEIYECDDCYEYSVVVWKRESIHKLSRIIV